MGNNKKAETLGMPHGTANGRLRKSIMFKYVVLAGDNFCFKCGAEIVSIDDLSIEHKEPWEGISAELFFDLDNIAFSHLKCNIPHTYSVPKRSWPIDKARCSLCKEILPVDSFHKSSNTYRGVQSTCKSCKKIRDAKRESH